MERSSKQQQQQQRQLSISCSAFATNLNIFTHSRRKRATKKKRHEKIFFAEHTYVRAHSTQPPTQPNTASTSQQLKPHSCKFSFSSSVLSAFFFWSLFKSKTMVRWGGEPVQKGGVDGWLPNLFTLPPTLPQFHGTSSGGGRGGESSDLETN